MNTVNICPNFQYSKHKKVPLKPYIPLQSIPMKMGIPAIFHCVKNDLDGDRQYITLNSRM